VAAVGCTRCEVLNAFSARPRCEQGCSGLGLAAQRWELEAFGVHEGLTPLRRGLAADECP
jgi:hypothetical protein